MRIPAFALAFLCLLSAGVLAQQSGSTPPMKMDQAMPDMRDTPSAHTPPGLSIYNLNGHWTTQDGVTEPLSALRGKPLVAAMVYTHCVDICPLIAERMQEVEQKIPPADRDSVRFVLFSLDWVRDTPEQLRHFASKHGLDVPHWTLFRGNESAVRELAAALGVTFYRTGNGDYQHSIAVFVLDADGVVHSQEDNLQRVPRLHPTSMPP